MIDIEGVSALLWVISNVVIAYDAITLIVFVVGYYALFDPSATTAGKVLFRFMVSLVGVISLAYFSLFFFPLTGVPWYVLPDTAELWWSFLRLGVYGYVAFTITSMAVLLVLRKWFPKRIKSAPVKELFQVRHDTEELDIVDPKLQQ